jgi:hypothetical protein
MRKVILKHENFEVISHEKSQFTIEFKHRAHKIINSIIKTRIIPGSSTNENYKLIKFKAETVKSLKEFQDNSYAKHGKKGLIVPDIAKMVRSLSSQLCNLIEEQSSTIIGYNPENIIVINDEKFAFLGSEFVAKIDEDTEEAIISCPFNVTEFFVSPELLKIKEIPAYIHYKIAYFSLACLLIFSITCDNEFYTEFLIHKEPQKMLEVLNNHPTKNTRIYWLLSRCLVEEAKNRSIILI